MTLTDVIDVAKLKELGRRYIFHSERDSFQQNLHEAYVRRRSTYFLVVMVVMFTGAILASWPLDFLYFSSDDLVRTLAVIRASLIFAMILLLIALYFTQLIKKYIFLLMASLLLTIVAIPGFVFGSLPGLRRPLFFVAIALPILSVFFSVKFIPRCVLTILIPVVYSLGFLIHSRDFGSTIVFNNLTSSEVVISILLGHVIFHINRNRFFQQRSLRVKKQRYEQLAARDSMTGLLKRRSFTLHAQEEFHRARNMDSTYSVLMIDLDRFKRINDEYGHLVGDHVLENVGKIIRHNIRHSDTAGRLGGEEFCLLLPETPYRGAIVLAERLREDIANKVFVGPKGNTFTITCSIGITEYRRNIRNTEALLREADQALYKAKAAGRDRIMLSDKIPFRTV